MAAVCDTAHGSDAAMVMRAELGYILLFAH